VKNLFGQSFLVYLLMNINVTSWLRYVVFMVMSNSLFHEVLSF